ncbi:MAG: hypothetical protein ABIO82_02320 [Ginsengibacter sp.]
MPAENIQYTALVKIYNSIDETNYQAIRQDLISILNQLINTGFSSLVQLLYKIDVDEKKIKESVVENAGSDTASVIADLIIRRQLEKIKTRKKFSGNPPSESDERW